MSVATCKYSTNKSGQASAGTLVNKGRVYESETRGKQQQDRQKNTHTVGLRHSATWLSSCVAKINLNAGDSTRACALLVERCTFVSGMSTSLAWRKICLRENRWPTSLRSEKSLLAPRSLSPVKRLEDSFLFPFHSKCSESPLTACAGSILKNNEKVAGLKLGLEWTVFALVRGLFQNYQTRVANNIHRFTLERH